MTGATACRNRSAIRSRAECSGWTHASRCRRPRGSARSTTSAASTTYPERRRRGALPSRQRTVRRMALDAIDVNVLFVGRLDPRKGVHLLIAAAPEVVRKTAGRARLLIVGDSYLAVAARGVGAGGDAPSTSLSSATCPQPTCLVGTRPATSSSRPRPATRASASCCSKRWRPDVRSCVPTSPAIEPPSFRSHARCFTPRAT